MANPIGFDPLVPLNPNSKSVTRDDLTNQDTIYLFDPTETLKAFNLSGGTSDGDNIAINALSNEFTAKVKGNVLTLTGLKNTSAAGVKVTVSLDATGGTGNLWFADGKVAITFTPSASGKGGTWDIGGVSVSKKINLSKNDKYVLDSTKTFAAAESVVNENFVTHNLTLAIGESINGTSGNDTFKGVLGGDEAGSTLNLGDEVNGLGGTDRLNLIVGAEAESIPLGVSIKDIEIINVANGGGIDLDAATFEGATQIWQTVSPGDVSNVQSTTTVGFRGAMPDWADGPIDVTAANTATSVSLAFDNLAPLDDSDDFDFDISGNALNTLNLSGTAGKNTDDDSIELEFDITAGSKVTTFTINSTIVGVDECDTTSSYYFTEGSEAITTLNATVANHSVFSIWNLDSLETFNGAASTGDIDLWGEGDTLRTITTGSGDDEIDLRTALTTTAATATVTTNAGDDYIDVETEGAVAGTKITVNAGADNDGIYVDDRGEAAVIIDAGAGDDIIDFTYDDTVLTTDSVNGGAGFDILSVDGEGYSSPDQLTGSNITGVEALMFMGTVFSTVVVDGANQLGSKYNTLGVYDGDAKFTDVTTQTILGMGEDYIDVYAKGYDAGKDAGGDLKLEVSADGWYGPAWSRIEAHGDAATLSVIAGNDIFGEDGLNEGAYASLGGDLVSATINVSSGTNYDCEDPIGHNLAVAELTIDSESGEQLGNLESVDLNGNGVVYIENIYGSLATIDASGLNSTFNADVSGEDVAGAIFYAFGEDEAAYTAAGVYGLNGDYEAGDKAVGLILSSKDGALSETVTLGNSVDILYFDGGSQWSANGTDLATYDTVSGLNLVLNETKTGLTNQSDMIMVQNAGGLGDSGDTDFKTVSSALTGEQLTAFNAISVGGAAARLEYLADFEHDAFVFAYNGATYVFVDNGDSTDNLDDYDAVIKLTGTIDLDALVVSLNTEPSVFP